MSLKARSKHDDGGDLCWLRKELDGQLGRRETLERGEGQQGTFREVESGKVGIATLEGYVRPAHLERCM